MPVTDHSFKSSWGITRIELVDDQAQPPADALIAQIEPSDQQQRSIRPGLEVNNALDGSDLERHHRLSLRCYEELASPLTRLTNVAPTLNRCASEWKQTNFFSDYLQRRDRSGHLSRDFVGLWGISEHGQPRIVEVAWFTGTQIMTAATEAALAGWHVLPVNFATNADEAVLLVYKTAP